MIAEAIREARTHDPEMQKTWVALVDGNEQQLNELERQARKHHIPLIVAVDIMHVYGYLCKAGRVFHPQGSPELAAWIGFTVGKVRESVSPARYAAPCASTAIAETFSTRSPPRYVE